MNKLSEIFKKKAFISFVTCGDPDLDSTILFVDKMIEAGVSLIELGIPFSDPIAEGDVISEADIRALKSKTTTDKIFDAVKKIRIKHKDFPLVFMTYANPVFSYGYDKFFKKCEELNMLGAIIPDLPFEERDEAVIIAKKYNQTIISMIAPTSEDRIKKIALKSEGFIYLVSSLGVTGMRDTFSSNLEDIVKKIKEYTKTPVAIGFGIKNEEQAYNMTKLADGAIVGSAIVSIIAKYGSDAAPYVYEYCTKMVEACNKAN